MKNTVKCMLLCFVLFAYSSISYSNELSKEQSEIIKKQTDEYVDKTFKNEGGKRDKQTLRAQYVCNNLLAAIIGNIKADLSQNIYSCKYKPALDIILDSNVLKLKKEYPKIDVDLKIAEAYMLEGSSCGMSNDYDSAIELLNKSVKYNKNNPDVYFNLGINYFAKNNRKKAEQSWNAAIKLNPSYKKDREEFLLSLKQ